MLSLALRPTSLSLRLGLAYPDCGFGVTVQIVGLDRPISTVNLARTVRIVGTSHPVQTIGTDWLVQTMSMGRPVQTIDMDRPVWTIDTGQPIQAVNTGQPIQAVNTGYPVWFINMGWPAQIVGLGQFVGPTCSHRRNLPYRRHGLDVWFRLKRFKVLFLVGQTLTQSHLIEVFGDWNSFLALSFGRPLKGSLIKCVTSHLIDNHN